MARSYRSFAKVNLHLQVIGRRTDGFHELRTVFQTIDLHDLVTVEQVENGVHLQVSDPQLSSGPQNLAHRAASAFLARWAPSAGVAIFLRKNIPLGGGLGGGSSNAATVLLALREIFQAPAELTDLWPLARALGADVPYFLVGGTALGVGRGDEVLPLHELPETDLYIATPPLHVSTRAVFEALPAPSAEPLAQCVMALAQGRHKGDAAALDGFNDLQEVVFRLFPMVREACDSLRESGASKVRLSGSGATLWASFANAAQAEQARSRLPEGTRLLRVRTFGRAVLEANRVAVDGGE